MYRLPQNTPDAFRQYFFVKHFQYRKSQTAPIFPYITEWKEIIEISKEYVDEYWFENLNLRGSYKKEILDYIKENYNELYSKYLDIYVTKNNNYWTKLADEINNYCEKNKIKYVNYFYHKELVEKKKEGMKNG